MTDKIYLSREKAHLWVTIVMVVLLSTYRLISLINVQVQDFFLSYTKFPIIEFLSNLLFFWLMGLLWITYHHWKKAVEYNHKLEDILKSISPDSIAVVDSSRRITMCSGQIESMFGLTCQNLIGQSTDTLYFDRRILGEKGEIAKRLEKYGFHVGYATGKRQNGETFPLEIITGVISGNKGAVILMRDITERQNAENALRESEARFELFMRYLPGCAFIKDSDGKYLFMNKYHEKIYGWDISEALGKTDRDLLPKDQAEIVMQNNRKVIESGAEMHYTTRIEKNNKAHSMLTCTFPIDQISSDQKLIGGISLDITEKEKAENERRNIERQMLQAQKMESLGVLGGGIAHDFNNLLMGILGHADIALSKIPTDSPGRHNLEAVVSSTQKAADLANQLLAYAGKGKFIVKSINISTLIEEMSKLLRVSISKNATLHFNLNQDLPAVKCDVTQLRQVVMNLIVNASDSLEGKPGDISIETGTIQLNAISGEQLLSDNRLPTGEYVYTKISDTGIGMTKENMQRIFDPFFTTKNSGHGLGLAAVQGIIRSHKGTITIDSSPDKGSTFTFYLPALDHAAKQKDIEAAPAKAWQGTGTVLVTDDDKIVRQVSETMLKSIGFQVVTVSSGQQTVRMIKENPTKFACVLLDLTMPDMSGMETYRQIRKIAPSLPVILSSGYDKSEEVSKLNEDQQIGFLKKPYRIQLMRDVFKQVLT